MIWFDFRRVLHDWKMWRFETGSPCEVFEGSLSFIRTLSQLSDRRAGKQVRTRDFLKIKFAWPRNCKHVASEVWTKGLTGTSEFARSHRVLCRLYRMTVVSSICAREFAFLSTWRINLHWTITNSKDEKSEKRLLQINESNHCSRLSSATSTFQ